MKKLLFILLLVPTFCFAETNQEKIFNEMVKQEMCSGSAYDAYFTMLYLAASPGTLIQRKHALIDDAEKQAKELQLPEKVKLWELAQQLYIINQAMSSYMSLHKSQRDIKDRDILIFANNLNRQCLEGKLPYSEEVLEIYKKVMRSE